jgi:ElaB/YqjD/DUF883 family membrane-anchored ribosome-binding protein
MIDIKALKTVRAIRQEFGLPTEVQQALATYDTLAEHQGTAAQREQQAIQSAAEQIIAAARDGKQLPDVGADIAKAAAADRATESVQKAVNQARERAGNELQRAAALNAEEIVTEHMRPTVHAAVEVINKHANTIPMGMDDPTAFRSPKAVQDAWRGSLRPSRLSSGRSNSGRR